MHHINPIKSQGLGPHKGKIQPDKPQNSRENVPSPIYNSKKTLKNALFNLGKKSPTFRTYPKKIAFFAPRAKRENRQAARNQAQNAHAHDLSWAWHHSIQFIATP